VFKSKIDPFLQAVCFITPNEIKFNLFKDITAILITDCYIPLIPLQRGTSLEIIKKESILKHLRGDEMSVKTRGDLTNQMEY